MGAPSARADSGPQGRHALRDTKPPWANSASDLGSTTATDKATARVYLAGRDPQGLAAYAEAVADPHSAQYGRYLSAQQARSRFGASPKQVAAVTAWLTGAGLMVTGHHQHYLTAVGSVSQAVKAFGTQLHDYTRNGAVLRAPSRAATVPASLDGAVLTVVGLDDTPSYAQPMTAASKGTLPPPGAVFRNAGPFSSYYGSTLGASLPAAYGAQQPYAPKGYTGTQLRGAYGATGSDTGQGVTVAVTGAYTSSKMRKDTAEYAKRNGDAAYSAGQLVEYLPASYGRFDECKPDKWYSEQALAIEAVHAVAPAAKIVYAGAASCGNNDLLDALSSIVDNRLASIVSNSWGAPEGYQVASLATVYDQIFQLGAVEGIGFYFASGDAGDNVASTRTKQVNAPAKSAWVTAVGGTSLAVGQDDTYQWETGWGTTKAALAADGTAWETLPGAFTAGGGGGTSKTVAQPSYQGAVVPDTLALANGGATKQRVVPDISAVADPNTGFLVGRTQTFPDGSLQYSEYRAGGTSLATPVVAGVQALVQQARSGQSLGFANPALYERYGTLSFHDVTDHPLGAAVSLGVARVDYVNGYDGANGLATSLRSLGRDSSLGAETGYDNVTGLGSPAAALLKPLP